MNNTMYFDTATSDAWNFSSDAEDHIQPHMVRLAWLLEDGHGVHIRDACHLIRLPAGERIAAGAANATRISNNDMERQDCRGLFDVLTEFAEALGETGMVVGFSCQFHKNVIDRSMRYVGMPARIWPAYECAMVRAKDIVRVPRKQPGGGFLFPSFTQCHEHFYGKPFQWSSDPKNDGMNRLHAIRFFWSNVRPTS